MPASSLVANQVTGNVSLPNDWPIGTYRAELFVDGKATARRDYVVTSPVREQRIQQFRVFLDDGAGGQGREVKTWASSDRRVHFRVTSDGLLAPSTKVVCVLRRGLNEVGTVRLTVPSGELQSDYIDLHFTNTKDWVAGSYSLAVNLDGREAGRARFIVVA